MEFKGCYVALVTPFAADGSIDEAGLRANIKHLIANGVSGLVPCGTTGESATLSWEEHNRVVDIAVEEAAGKVQVIAGAGSNNTKEAVEAAKHAKDCGADAILCITPYYNKPTQDGLYYHFKEIVKNVDIPVVVYNVPGRTGVNLEPETLERLCEFDSIIGVKEASGDLIQVSEIHTRLGDRLAILSGDDALTLPMLTLGASGVISVTGNFLPAKMTELVNSFFEGDLKKARELHEYLMPISNSMFIETNPIPVKAVMNYLGLAAGSLRLPLVEITEGNKTKLISVLKKHNVKI